MNNNIASHRIRHHRGRLYNDPTSGGGSSSSSSSSSSDEHSSQPVSLFEDNSGDVTTAKFGESVPLKKPVSAETASFGESVPLKRPSTSSNNSSSDTTDTTTVLMTDNSNFMEAAAATINPQPESGSELAAMRKRNLSVAVASVLFAVTSYLWQFTHPITPVQLLASMQSTSAPLTSIGTNGKPTVVDFWAPWCENCKMAAPTLLKLEEDYKDQVNFVMINGDQAAAWPLIERFGVDAIPHLALISAEGDVETALIGPVPKRVLEADLNVLLENAAASNKGSSTAPKQELPYKMLDAFANQPELRRIHFKAED